jgi:putative transposase
MLMQRLKYIHNNPVKRGYVDLPEHWRYSSARDYLGQKGLLPVVLLV